MGNGSSCAELGWWWGRGAGQLVLLPANQQHPRAENLERVQTT